MMTPFALASNGVNLITSLNSACVITPRFSASVSSSVSRVSSFIAVCPAITTLKNFDNSVAPFVTLGTMMSPICVPSVAVASSKLLSAPVAVFACSAISPPKSPLMLCTSTLTPSAAGMMPFSIIFDISAVDTPAASAK